MDDRKKPESVRWQNADSSKSIPPECDRLGQALSDLESAIGSIMVLNADKAVRSSLGLKSAAVAQAEKCTRECVAATIGVISKQLGHASISTTAHYLDHIAPWAVVDQIATRAW